MKFGIQTYGISEWIEENPETFFEELIDDGFSMLEPCVWEFPQESPAEALWSIEKMDEMAQIALKKGMTINSVHVFTENLVESKKNLQKLNKEYGVQSFVVKLKEPFQKQELVIQAEHLMEAAIAVAEFGGQILIHNEKKDIETKIDGVSAYEWILLNTENKVFAEVDIGWLLAAGEDPEAFLWRNKEKIRAVHFKDFICSSQGEREVPVGMGDVDTTACFQFMRAMEIPGILDMDQLEKSDIKESGIRLQSLTNCRDNTRSFLNIYDVERGETIRLAEFEGIIEAPNWLNDEDTILYNANGSIWKYSISSGKKEKIETGICDNCNNDHVPSPDNKKVAVSHSPKGTWNSQIYIIPMDGGIPQIVVDKHPSFLHGWSPDGKELAYCGFRSSENGHVEINIYTSSIEYGEEKALTAHQGMNDGPEYQMDGKKIWFISNRNGLMQVYRMNRDGTNQEQMTFEQQNNWFGHISPDGSQVVNIAYSKNGLESTEHLPNMEVSLWLMNSDGSDRRKILNFFGGQGTINVNSWSPDSKKFAFVSYELIHK